MCRSVSEFQLSQLAGQACELPLAKHLQADKGDAGETHASSAGPPATARKNVKKKKPGNSLQKYPSDLISYRTVPSRGQKGSVLEGSRAPAPASLSSPFLTADNSGKKPKECRTCGFGDRNCERAGSPPVCRAARLPVPERSLLKSVERR